ncbi:MAG: GNAT family N-acetyltransferase [Acidobacteriota bacterium]|nr:GNAT family N-acetyltransferase [Acidobacteriota bacterium]
MAKITIPEKVETERLTLRRYRSEDAAGIVELVRENREQLIREFAAMTNLQNLDQAASFVREKEDQWEAEKTFCFGIWLKDRGKQIGQIQMKNVAWEIPAGELSYFIDREFQQKRYATESIRAILDLAFLKSGFQRIYVRVLPVNRESLSLARKLGFQSEGVHRKAFRCGAGDLHDVHFLSLIAEDYST